MKLLYIPRKKLLQAGAVILVVLACAIYIAVGTAGGAQAAWTQAKKPLPIYNVQTDEKKVAVTFDAAWGDEQTEGILALLDKYNVKATFFLVGYWVDKYPDKVKLIYERGHEIGNHSSTHPHMSGMSSDAILQEIRTTSAKIQALTGQGTVNFRPPYGDYDSNLISTCNNAGISVIQWNVDSLDWKDLTGDQMLKRVRDKLEPGSIILFHNNSKYILDGLEKTLQELQSQGYEAVRVCDLIYTDNYVIDHTGRQIPVEATPAPQESPVLTPAPTA